MNQSEKMDSLPKVEEDNTFHCEHCGLIPKLNSPVHCMWNLKTHIELIICEKCLNDNWEGWIKSN